MAALEKICIQKFFLWDKEQCGSQLSQLQLIGQQSTVNQSQLQLTQGISDCVDGGVLCGVCGVDLETRDAQLLHYSTEFHSVNQARSLRGLHTLTLDEYEKVVSEWSAESSLSPSDAEHGDSDGGESEDEHGEDTSSSPSLTTLGSKPRLYFVSRSTGNVVSLWRPVLTKGKANSESSQSLTAEAEQVPSRIKWTFLMRSGGHFAGAVFQGEQVVVHKTFHSYTVRAGQGGSQSTCDKGSAGVKRSAGASLRRYNEQTHLQHIHELIEEWHPHFKSSDLIFVTGNRHMQNAMFAKINGLSTRDPRVRSVPFPTRRPTFAEIKRVHRILAEVTVHGSEDEFLRSCVSAADNINSSNVVAPARHSTSPSPSRRSSSSTSSSSSDTRPSSSSHARGAGTEQPTNNTTASRKKKKKQKNKRATSAVPIAEDVLITDLKETMLREAELECVKDVLFTACRSGQLERLQALYKYSKGTEQDDSALNGISEAVREGINHHLNEGSSVLQLRLGQLNKTALHVATEAGHRDIVSWLLETGEADPGVNDARNRVPYSYCSNKPMRFLYKDYRNNNPEAYDYKRSSIPAPQTDAEKDIAAEERKMQKAAKKSRLNDSKKKREQLLQEQKLREEFLKLSDREKRALAAERRFAEMASTATDVNGPSVVIMRCFQCGNDISSMVPFEYSTYKFCSSTCVRLHRIENN